MKAILTCFTILFTIMGKTITFGKLTRALMALLVMLCSAVGAWAQNWVYLTDLNESYTAQNGDILMGALTDDDVKLSIADGATVTLNFVEITLYNKDWTKWAGITCEGDATIILKGTNNVRGCEVNYPGIFVPVGKTLTIKGDGELYATYGGPYGMKPNEAKSAAIGGGYQMDCGNIVIEGGQIYATGGTGVPAIGNGKDASCGTITLGYTSDDDCISATYAIDKVQFAEGKTFLLDGTTTVATLDNINGQKIVPVPLDPWGTNVGGWCGNPAVNDGKNVYYEFVTSSSGKKALVVSRYSKADGDDSSVFTGWAGKTDFAQVEIQEGVSSLCSEAFKGCTGIKRITIAGSVKSFGTDAFSGCTAVTDVYCFTDAASLTWSGNGTSDFNTSTPKSTTMHVKEAQLAAYQQKFPNANVTFVGDLDHNYYSDDNQSGYCGVVNKNLYYVIESDGGQKALTIASNPAVSLKSDFMMEDYDALSYVAPVGVVQNFAPWNRPLKTIYQIEHKMVDTDGDGTPDAMTSISTIIGFESQCEIVTVTIQDGVTGIGNSAFEGFPQIENVYCYADPDYLTWLDGGVTAFNARAPKSTLFHVYSQYLATYQQKFPNANVTFVGDLPGGVAVIDVAQQNEYIANDGDVLTGTTTTPVHIQIADGATVTLKNLTIDGNPDGSDDTRQWASITCLGDATIILEGENYVTSSHQSCPAIQAGGSGTTLTIKGSGSLVAQGGGSSGAGIGSGYEITCGDIAIEGGDIKAFGGQCAAGIGSGGSASCGDIIISGGTIEAKSNSLCGVGIGAGDVASCGDITITDGITKVVSYRGPMGDEYIGAGDEGSHGTITISPNLNSVIGDETLTLTPGSNAIDSVTADEAADVWCTLSGVKLDGKPTAPGIYICGGRRVVIK